jgi:putative transposase
VPIKQPIKQIQITEYQPMTTYRRLYTPGGQYFFTVVTHQRRPILVANIERLRAAFHHVMTVRPFKVVAMVVLPDHLHCIWCLPENDLDFSTRWSIIKRYFSTVRGKGDINPSLEKKRERGVWQRRFWEHCLHDEDDWCRHMDYIHFNPVKHGYVSSPREWPYSSLTRAIARGWYDLNWGETEPPSLRGLELE